MVFSDDQQKPSLQIVPIRLQYPVDIRTGSIIGTGQVRRRTGMVVVESLCVFYVSDEIISAIQAFLRKCDLRELVRVVEIPPASLKKQQSEITHKFNCAHPQNALFAHRGARRLNDLRGHILLTY